MIPDVYTALRERHRRKVRWRLMRLRLLVARVLIPCGLTVRANPGRFRRSPLAAFSNAILRLVEFDLNSFL